MTEYSFHAWCPYTGHGTPFETKEEADDRQEQIDEAMSQSIASELEEEQVAIIA